MGRGPRPRGPFGSASTEIWLDLAGLPKLPGMSILRITPEVYNICFLLPYSGSLQHVTKERFDSERRRLAMHVVLACGSKFYW